MSGCGMERDLVSSDRLPSLTAETIERVKEGVAAARDRAVCQTIQQTLLQLEAYPRDLHEPRANSRLRRCALRSFVRALFRVRVEHLERLPDGPAILAANHLNHIDPLLLLAEMPPHPYYYVLGDARTLYNHAWKRSILGLSVGVIPIERWWKEERAVVAAVKAGRQDLKELSAAIEQDVLSGGDVRSLRQIDRIVQSILKRGDGAIVFCEGRLGIDEGKLYQPLKRGTALYALKAGVPIVPAVLIGTQDLYLGKELTLRFGEPLRFPAIERPKRQEVDAVMQVLQQALMDLLPVDYKDPPGPKLLRHFLNHMLW